MDRNRIERNIMPKRQFPLSLVPAPRGWHLVITPVSGQPAKLFKPGKRNDAHIPILFASQQEAWDYIKQRFSFILSSNEPIDTLYTEKMRNCKQCDRIFRVKQLDYCTHCLNDNLDILQQLWLGFRLDSDSDFTDQQKMTVILNSSEEDFLQIPDLFISQVKQQIAAEAELADATPSPARQLSKIIRSRVNAGRRRHAH